MKFLVTFILALFFISDAMGLRKILTDETGIPLNRPDIAIDQVALSYQKTAIDEIKKQTHLRSNKKRKASILLKLADYQSKYSEIIFRLAHEKAYLNKKKIDLTDYKIVLKSSIEILSDFITSYPKNSSIVAARYMRADFYSETSQVARAKKDYHFILKNFPRFERRDNIYMNLAEFSINEGNHKKTIKYLSRFLKNTKHRSHEYALSKTAWSYYYMGRITPAMSYLTILIKRHDKELKRMKKPDLALILTRDALLEDSALFFLKGFEEGIKEYSLLKSPNFFRTLADGPRSDNGTSQAFIKLVEFMVAHDHYAEVEKLSKHMLTNYSIRRETMLILLRSLNAHFNNGRYREYISTQRTIEKLYRKLHKRGKIPYSFKIAEETLTGHSKTLQAELAKKTRKEPKIIAKKGEALISLYHTLAVLLPRKDIRRFKVRHNLTLALVDRGHQSRALTQMLWIIKRGKKSKKWSKIAGFRVFEVGMRALELKHSFLKKENILLGKVLPRQFARGHGKGSSGKLDPKLISWFELIQRVKKFRDPSIDKKETREKLAFYEFDAYLTLYGKSDVQTGLNKLMDFIKANPNSKYAAPSAGFVVDTLLLNKDWKQLRTLIATILKTLNDKKLKITAKLKKIQGEALYKIAERAYNRKAFKKVIKIGEELDQEALGGPHKWDWHNLLAQSSLALGKIKEAKMYLNTLASLNPNNPYSTEGSLLRAQVFEKEFKFSKTAKAYERYIKVIARNQKRSKDKILTGKRKLQISSLRRKILTLAWVSHDKPLLNHFLNSNLICSPRDHAIKKICNQYEVFMAYENSKRGANRDSILKYMEKSGDSKNFSHRTLWAMMALSQPKKFNINNRFVLLSRIESGWASLDPMIQMSLIDHLPEIVDKTFRITRREVKRSSPIRADGNSIDRRIKLIKKVEMGGEIALKLPWARIQANVMNHIGLLYMDLKKDIINIKAPEGLKGKSLKEYRQMFSEIAQPFGQNALQIMKRAFNNASLAGIERRPFENIAINFFNANPATKKQLLPGGKFVRMKDGNGDQLDFFEFFESHLNKGDDPIVERWASAIAKNDLRLADYFFRLLQANKKTSSSSIYLMLAVTLSKAGAQVEALSQLKRINKFPKGSKLQSLIPRVLAKSYINTLNVQKAHRYLSIVHKDMNRALNKAPFTRSDKRIFKYWSKPKRRKII